MAMVSLVFVVAPYALRMAGAFPPVGDPALIPTLFALVTVSNGLAVASMMLAQSMAADVVEASQAETGERSEGIFFSAYFFTQKCATGLGQFLSGSIVSLAGIPAKAVPGQVDPAALDRFALYFLVLLIVIATASMVFLSRFPITRADHVARVAALAKARGD